MDYFYSLTDTHGYVHSIDNCIVTYYVHNIGLKPVDRLIEEMRKLQQKYPECNYYEKLGVGACRKYHFYQNMIHLDDGITVFIGHYLDYDKDKKEAYVFPMMKLKINPNKHAGKAVFKDFMDVVNKNCYDAVLNSYDYAIDIPLAPSDIQVFGTNKEKGLMKGTRYYGQRDKNGFCRIYNKAEEQGIEGNLTRVEHVVSLTKSTKNLSFEKVYVKSDKEESGDISKTDEVIVKLCTLCKANNLDYEDILNGLDRRKRKTIIGYIAGCGYAKLEYDLDIHDRLVSYYRDFFGVKEAVPETDEEGFLKLPDGFKLPFD